MDCIDDLSELVSQKCSPTSAKVSDCQKCVAKEYKTLPPTAYHDCGDNVVPMVNAMCTGPSGGGGPKGCDVYTGSGGSSGCSQFKGNHCESDPGCLRHLDNCCGKGCGSKTNYCYGVCVAGATSCSPPGGGGGDSPLCSSLTCSPGDVSCCGQRCDATHQHCPNGCSEPDVGSECKPDGSSGGGGGGAIACYDMDKHGTCFDMDVEQNQCKKPNCWGSEDDCCRPPGGGGGGSTKCTVGKHDKCIATTYCSLNTNTCQNTPSTWTKDFYDSGVKSLQASPGGLKLNQAKCVLNGMAAVLGDDPKTINAEENKDKTKLAKIHTDCLKNPEKYPNSPVKSGNGHSSPPPASSKKFWTWVIIILLVLLGIVAVSKFVFSSHHSHHSHVLPHMEGVYSR